MNHFENNTPVTITVGSFKGRPGVITGYRVADQSYTIKLEGESPDVRWRASEFKVAEEEADAE